MNIEGLKDWGIGAEKPIIISGPCSAETEEQLYDTAVKLKELGVKYIRAGIWKPRTRPNNFEGIGIEALSWIQNIKKETGLKFAIEVAKPKHVYEAIKHNVDMLWIGARSTTNPFTVQEIAEALRGADIPIMVKNPINPDLALWLGAIERISNVGITKIGAIHRGFSSFKQMKYRNMPMWQIALDLKSTLNNIPLICDPSHICGSREWLFEISQKAFDLDYDGLIIESHRDPENAWSDAAQQITPVVLGSILKNLQFRKPTSEDKEFITHLEELRQQIDHLDKELFEIVAQRMGIVDEIGFYKKRNNVTVFQKSRWQEIAESRQSWAQELNLNKDVMFELFKIIHDASIRRQEVIMNTPLEDKKKVSDHRIKFCNKNLTRQLTDFFQSQTYSNIAVLVDENTDQYCYDHIVSKLPPHIKIVIESGEEKKNLTTCELIWDYLTNHNFDRKSLLVNLGGGVIGDMGGFCASTYKRGIDFINLPSTLLAQVDASIGGKLGIDFKGLKNHIGIFQQPKKVFIDPAFLETLDPRELRSGFAEVIKHALIADSIKFNELEGADLETLNWNDIIPHSIKIKEQIVKSDPKENGLRKILNFGHTIGHAIESYFLENTSSKLLHGEAIAIGMICESYLSTKKSKLPENQLSRIKDYILRVFQPGIIDEDAIKNIIPLAIQDKKNESGFIKAALLKQIGTCSFDVIIDADDIEESLTYYNKMAFND